MQTPLFPLKSGLERLIAPTPDSLLQNLIIQRPALYVPKSENFYLQ